MWAEHFNGPAEVAGLSQALRWCAAASGNWRLLHEATSGYRLATGTASLATAMADDGNAEIHLGTVVTSITQDGDHATVTTAQDGHHTARRVVCTLPLNVLDSIDFQPALPEAKRAASGERTASQGLKTWIRVRGQVAPFTGYAPHDHALTFVRPEYTVDGDTVLVAFGPRASQLDPNDRTGVAHALRVWRDDLEILEVTGHNWMDDQFSRETWPMHRPGQLTKYLRALQDPHGPIHFAGSDIANGWAGFIDGALESGLHAARKVDNALRSRLDQ